MIMMKNKIGLIGYLGYAVDNPIIGGQMSKTRGIEEQLKLNYTKLQMIDTSNWKKEKIKLALQCLWMAITCKTIIIMPNKNGIKFVLPFFAKMKKIFKYRLAYPVVGGWLTGLLEKHKILRESIVNVDYILPETGQLQSELHNYYEGKTDVMSIFSTRSPVKKEQIREYYEEPYVFCTFSRVTPEKGIDDAIRAVKAVNTNANRTVCKLDIWGPIEPGKEEHYQRLFDEHADCVQYMGVLNAEQGLETLCPYYMMLFPTFYPGEGFPTSVCESLMSGVPVIAYDWRFNNELIQDGETGYLVPVHDIDGLIHKMEGATKNPEWVYDMHLRCLKKSEDFVPEKVMKKLNLWISKKEGEDKDE